MRISRIVVLAVGVFLLGVVGVDKVVDATADDRATTSQPVVTKAKAVTPKASSSSETPVTVAESSSVVAETSTSAVQQPVAVAETQQTAVTASVVPVTPEEQAIKAVVAHYTMPAGAAYNVSDLTDGLYQVEARVASPNDDATNLVGIYHYNANDGTVQRLNYQTGMYE